MAKLRSIMRINLKPLVEVVASAKLWPALFVVVGGSRPLSATAAVTPCRGGASRRALNRVRGPCAQTTCVCVAVWMCATGSACACVRVVRVRVAHLFRRSSRGPTLDPAVDTALAGGETLGELVAVPGGG